MRVKYLLNLNSNHTVDNEHLQCYNKVDVFVNNLEPYKYKTQEILKEICHEKIKHLERKSDDRGEFRYLGFDEPVYVVYSGLAVVMIAFINELIKEGYRPIVLFEDKDNGGYYKMEVNY